jgi:hypothetical protein
MERRNFYDETKKSFLTCESNFQACERKPGWATQYGSKRESSGLWKRDFFHQLIEL